MQRQSNASCIIKLHLPLVACKSFQILNIERKVSIQCQPGMMQVA